MKYQTYLPAFPGFYNSYLEADFECELDSEHLPEGVNCDDLLAGWCNGEYEHAVVNRICEFMPSWFPEEADIKGFYLQKITHPREYNFSTDSADIEVETGPGFGPWVMAYLKDNAEAWEGHLRSHYTSRDGFASFYSNDPDDWGDVLSGLIDKPEETDDPDRFDRRPSIDHALGRFLDFWIEQEIEDPQMDLYYDVSEHIYVGEYIDDEKVKQHMEQRKEIA